MSAFLGEDAVPTFQGWGLLPDSSWEPIVNPSVSAKLPMLPSQTMAPAPATPGPPNWNGALSVHVPSVFRVTSTTPVPAVVVFVCPSLLDQSSLPAFAANRSPSTSNCGLFDALDGAGRKSASAATGTINATTAATANAAWRRDLRLRAANAAARDVRRRMFPEGISAPSIWLFVRNDRRLLAWKRSRLCPRPP